MFPPHLQHSIQPPWLQPFPQQAHLLGGMPVIHRCIVAREVYSRLHCLVTIAICCFRPRHVSP
jgi:hypothetical protein